MIVAEPSDPEWEWTTQSETAAVSYYGVRYMGKCMGNGGVHGTPHSGNMEKWMS